MNETVLLEYIDKEVAKSVDDEVNKIKIGSRWIWIMDVILGGIATYAIRRFVEVIENPLILPSLSLEFITIIVGVFSVFVFFIYDVTVLHVLYKKYPYSFHWLSVFRFITDIIMIFFLALIVLPVICECPQKATVILLVSISVWHIFAILWHLLAHFEVKDKNDDISLLDKILLHLISPIFYWLLAFSVLFHQGITFSFSSLKDIPVFISVCVAIIVVSFVRSLTLVQKFKEES